MSYTALYRKFRPDTFSKVQGQEHITKTLKNQIKAKRIGHAYLFCGTRGTGKTTVAKILAKAINCSDPADGDPCGKCPSCISIASGNNTDVIEMDAASNNSVDDMRNIIEEVSYTPGMSKYRVYIVDEVHMLSNSAFNAFLKTLEEPPAHAVFILATTDPQNLPATILSRCQRYDFHRMSVDTIRGHMKSLLSQEGLEAEDEALAYVAKAADGSMRDALSLLDQCISFHQGDKLTYESVLDILGAVDRDIFEKILDSLRKADVTACISLVDDITQKGRELSQFVMDLTGYIRDILLEGVKAGETQDAGELMYYIRELSDLTEKMRRASMKRVLLDTELIKLCRPAMTAKDGDDSLKRRIAYLEKKLEELESRPAAPVYINGSGAQTGPGFPGEMAGMGAPGYPNGAGAPFGMEGHSSQNYPYMAGMDPAIPPKPVYPKAVPEDLKPLKGKWREIIGRLDPPDSNYISAASMIVGDDGGLVIVFNDDTSLKFFETNDDSKGNLKSIIEDILQKSVDITYIIKKPGPENAYAYQNLFDSIDMPVEIED